MQNISLRAKIITQLHNIYLFAKNHKGGYDKCLPKMRKAMNEVLAKNNITFRQPQDIDTIFFLIDITDIENEFYDAIKREVCNDIAYFAIQCELWLNWTEVLRKQHVATCGGSQAYVTLISRASDIPAYFKLRA